MSECKIRDYLAQAAQAERLSEALDDPSLRACWANVASGYRELARLARNKNQSVAGSKQQPSIGAAP